MLVITSLLLIATVVSKLLEFCMLPNFKDFLKTNDKQFGFKANHSTDISVFLLKQIVSYVS